MGLGAPDPDHGGISLAAALGAWDDACMSRVQPAAILGHGRLQTREQVVKLRTSHCPTFREHRDPGDRPGTQSRKVSVPGKLRCISWLPLSSLFFFRLNCCCLLASPHRHHQHHRPTSTITSLIIYANPATLTLEMGTQTPISHASASPMDSSTCLALPVHAHTHTHQVQFYNNDQHLFNTITSYLSPLFDESYEDGTSAIIIARPAPTRYLKDALITRGYKSEFGDTNQPRSNELLNLFDASTTKGRHVLFIDAHQLLGQMMNGTGINSRDFEVMMSDVLSLLPGSEKRTGERQSLLYAYGELVDILCERQQHWIALELEELWNGLLSARHFSLLCGYKMDSFQDEGVADMFQHICQTHTNVLPTESYAIQGTPEQKLIMVAALQQNVTSLEASVKRQYDSFKREEQQRRHQEQLVDIFSHQLRNPVSCIAGNVELLVAGLGNRNAVIDTIVASRGLAKPSDIASVKMQLLDDAKSVDAIVACAAHMKTVTDGLLSLSREKGRALHTLSHQTPTGICIGPPPSTNSESNSNAKSSPSQTKHVLLVDDNWISSRVHVRLLEASKILVTTASNGYEAIGKLINHFQSETPVNVVLMELDMPFMDGVATTRAIRQLRISERNGLASTLNYKISNVPIIGMTFHLHREKYVDAGLAGIDECVERPISREALLSLVHSLKLGD